MRSPSIVCKIVTLLSVLTIGLSVLGEAALAGPSGGGAYLTVTGASVKRAKLAVGRIHPLPDATATDPALAIKIKEQLRTDLEFAALFDVINESLFVAADKPADIYNMNYQDFAQLNASFALKLGYKIQSGKLVMEAIFYDVPGQRKVFGNRYSLPTKEYYRVVHAIVEDILKEIAGEKGLFFSRILMVCRDNKRKNPPKDIFIMDPDGRNLIALTNDNTLSLSPGWAPDGKNISYTQFEFRTIKGIRKKAIVFKKHNLQSGDRVVLSALEGMNSGGAWAPNGKQIAATLSFSGRPEMYLIDPASPGNPEPLSRNIQWKRISGDGYQPNSVNMLFDVEPSWSPDGSKLVFSSRRTGHPNIYIVDLASKTATQLTFAGTYNATPAWSPKGDKILFAAQRTGEGHFDLYIIDPDGNNLARITNGDRPGRRINSENPSWAPTGRHFAFANNEGGGYSIYITTVDGSFKRKISPEGKDCTMPAWGPAGS